MNVLHVVTRDDGRFLLTVTGPSIEADEIRATFDLELKKEKRPYVLKLPRTEVEFIGRADIGVKIKMLQIRCIGCYTDELTAPTEKTTVTPSQ